MRIERVTYLVGFVLIIASVVSLVLSFKDMIFLEVKYRLGFIGAKQSQLQLGQNNSDNLTISIPKVGVNAEVFLEVDPYNKEGYSKALKQGAAHAKGTAYPGQEGNVFIFAHSSSPDSSAGKYNTIFSLLNKLKEGDEVYLVYGKDNFKYKVTQTKIINAEEVGYINSNSVSDKKTVTLMTCWPIGTNWKRLLVIGELAELS